jgi:hypothetical protein
MIIITTSVVSELIEARPVSFGLKEREDAIFLIEKKRKRGNNFS